ncbi:hypothetical protein BY996DRAFT_6414185 [Phakopsora pachyrhizi]|uniref:Expressed protein n=1 Tax=Phakopsora pachyrhizi TaxID=170000 RepID=A0AAV0BTS0_PHAPC|nr:hypothetical protein BY996DRAFT_6414185 [Phakopsora pachyrhizi]CAH7689716.1 expressed protein [Phakopsora pachyrhizi]
MNIHVAHVFLALFVLWEPFQSVSASVLPSIQSTEGSLAIFRRQSSGNLGGNQIKTKIAGGSNGVSDLSNNQVMVKTPISTINDKENSKKESEKSQEAAENIPNLKTIAHALKEVYYEDKYGTQNSDPVLLVRMVGKVISENSKSGNPEVVSRAILDVFDVYNETVTSGANSQTKKNSANLNASQRQSPNNSQQQSSGASNANGNPTEQSQPVGANDSLKTIAKALKEVHEKEEHSETKSDMTQLVKVLGQEIGTSSRSGDAKVVATAIETAYSNFAKQNSPTSSGQSGKPSNPKQQDILIQ